MKKTHRPADAGPPVSSLNLLVASLLLLSSRLVSLDVFLLPSGCRWFLARALGPALTLAVPARRGCELWGNTGAD